MKRRKLIVDQDAFGPGGSNLQAILMTLQAPDVEVLGLTIVSGDGWVRENVAHALRMLELIGRTEVPVFVGAEQPLVNTEQSTREWEKAHGPLPYKGAWMETWPDYNTVHRPPYHGPEVVPPSPAGEPTMRPAAESAAEFLVRQVRAFPGEVTILAMGPFTNLALAARLDPEFASLARELVFMGASFAPDARGSTDEFALQFIHNPRVEFNCRFDPEAAAQMLRAGWRKITCVPLDATVRTKLTAELLARACRPPAQASAAVRAPSPVQRYVERFAGLTFPMWDEVATAVCLDPTVVTMSLRLAMDIDVDHGANYGATLSWPPGSSPGAGEPEVVAVLDIDLVRFEALFVSLMQQTTTP